MKVAVCFLALGAMITCAAGLAVMSVDFGSEFMKIAIVKPGVPMEIALNKESLRKTPMVVAMMNGDRLFSDPAMSVAMKHPQFAYQDFLDLLGKKASNPIVQEYQKRYPYYNIEADPDTGLVLFRHDEDTVYSVEELTAMVLESAKMIASDFAEQPIMETVITVPVYFNQAERRAMLRAADMAGLKVLQLLNDNTAVALNYGVFRRKEFNGTAVHHIFFDMGSSKTTVTVASYQLTKAKNPVTSIEETFPQVTIKGVGFDRTLGGREFQRRLAEHLAQEFTKTKKTPNNVYDNPRALQKLHKEAGRLKNVLSANAYHFAQIEGLLDDEDFRVKVTKEQFEEMCSDLFERVSKVLEEAMKSSDVTLAEVSEVILMGGGTRVPKVQEVIQNVINRPELGRSINTDEAAALGASYQAAHLSKGYKVKKFGIKDANLFPIQVEFEKARSGGEEGDTRTVKRVLFGHMNPFPQKKVMTFNKHSKDFSFVINYGDMSMFNQDFISGFGKTTLQEVALIGIENAHTKHAEGEPKGTKAHFRMDESGILVLDKVESLFEKLIVEEVKKEESTFSKIGNTISNFFGGGKEEEKNVDKEGSVDEGKDEEVVDEKSQDADNAKSDQSEDPKQTETKDDKQESKEDEGSKSKEGLDKVKDTIEKTTPIAVKEEIQSDVLFVDVQDPSDAVIKLSKKKIADLRKKDDDRIALAASQHGVEAFIVETQDKLYRDIFEKCSTEEEREEIRTKLSEASDWLYELEEGTERKVYDDKLKELKSLTEALFQRVYEAEERPKAMATLNSIVNYTEFFRHNMENLTGEDKPFTEVEFKSLNKLIESTKEWNATMQLEQKDIPMHEKPKLLVEDIARKIGELDREVKYLMSKLKSFRPKPKPKETNKTEETIKKKSKETKEEDLEIVVEDPDEAVSDGEADKTTEAAADEETLELPPADSDGDETSEKKSTHEIDDEL